MIQQDEQLGQFSAMYLDGIEASLVDLLELVYCIVTHMSASGAAHATPASTSPSTHSPQPSSGARDRPLKTSTWMTDLNHFYASAMATMSLVATAFACDPANLPATCLGQLIGGAPAFPVQAADPGACAAR